MLISDLNFSEVSMIYDSWQWKKELTRQRKKIKHLAKKRWNDRTLKKCSHQIDLAFLTSAFIIRKLIESDKLSNEADSYKLNVICYTPRRHIDKLHKWVEDGDYEWGERKSEIVSAKTICNSLIHSYVYSPYFSETHKLIGFLVVSDHGRNELLYEIELQDWMDYMIFIETDDVCEALMHFNEQKNDYILTMKKRG